MSSPTNPTSATCSKCHREIPEGQRVEHRGNLYCMDCVGKALNEEATGWATVRSAFQAAGQETAKWLAVRRETGPRSPVAAVLLSLIPGLGQMYNGQLRKGVVVLGGFLVLATGGMEPVLGALLHTAAIVTLYFWNLFDAHSTAQRITQGEIPSPPLPARPEYVEAGAGPLSAVSPQQPPSPPAPRTSGARAAWGVFLIILGVLFLLSNYGIAWLTWHRIWPVALLALGIWMLISFSLVRLRPTSPETTSQEAEK
jgi:TM2 domain-containing membrane protein YozV